MHIGISMSTIDHRHNTRNAARGIAAGLQKRFNLTSIELVLEGVGRLMAPYPWEFEAAELDELASFLAPFERRGAHLPFFNLNVIAANERVREDAMEQLQSAIDIAKRLELDYVVAHATGTTEGLATESEPRRQFLAFTRMAGFCEGSGLSLSVENAGNLHNIEQCGEMIRSLRADGLPVTMTFDTGHWNINYAGQTNKGNARPGTIADAIESNIDIIDNIHLHNNDGTSDQHLGLENGTIDLASCIDRLKRLKYAGSLTIETGDNVDDLSAEVALLKKWCEETDGKES